MAPCRRAPRADRGTLRDRLRPLHAPGGPRLTEPTGPRRPRDRADDRSVCPPGCACTVGNEFGERSARHDLEQFRRRGPDRTTLLLIEGLRGGGDVDGLTILDIGAGVGAVHLTLLGEGAISAVDVDGSPAYVDVARREAERLGVAARIRYETGDFVELAPRVPPADLVALDRVVCCYPDMRALVGLSVARARRRYGLVYPRDSWWIRIGSDAGNAVLRLLRRRLRFHVHRTSDVERIVLGAGFTPSYRRRGIFWQVAVFERHAASTP